MNRLRPHPRPAFGEEVVFNVHDTPYADPGNGSQVTWYETQLADGDFC